MYFRASNQQFSLKDGRPHHISSGYTLNLKPLMLGPLASSSYPYPAPARGGPSHDPMARRADGAPFFLHEDADAFYNSRTSSADVEAGCLVPTDSDAAVPDLASKKNRRSSIYIASRRWFPRASPRSSAVHLPLEKGAEPRGLERRLQAGSWCAMVVLLMLTIYFLKRER